MSASGPVEPEQNSLGEHLASLAKPRPPPLPYDVMVLPRPRACRFTGLQDPGIKQLADHHEDRCRLIAEACRGVPQTSEELVPVVFNKYPLDVHQMGFASSELIAHVNYALNEGRLTSEVTDGVLRFRPPDRESPERVRRLFQVAAARSPSIPWR